MEKNEEICWGGGGGGWGGGGCSCLRVDFVLTL
jgi:hypothetical protein